MARRKRKRRDDRYRGGDHKRAGAGDHKEHESPVHPALPCTGVKENAAGHDSERKGEDARGVDGGELVDEALHGGFLLFGGLDRGDDAGRHGVARHFRRPDDKAALERDGSGPDFRAGALCHGKALARDRRLVHRAFAFKHDAVERRLLSGLEPVDGADRNRLGGHLAPEPVHAYLDRVRGMSEQRADGVSRASRGKRLDRFADLVERHHHGGFGPGAEQASADHGNAHERAHVERESKQVFQTAQDRAHARQRDRSSACCNDRIDVRAGELHDFGSRRKGERNPEFCKGRLVFLCDACNTLDMDFDGDSRLLEALCSGKCGLRRHRGAVAPAACVLRAGADEREDSVLRRLSCVRGHFKDVGLFFARGNELSGKADFLEHPGDLQRVELLAHREKCLTRGRIEPHAGKARHPGQGPLDLARFDRTVHERNAKDDVALFRFAGSSCRPLGLNV